MAGLTVALLLMGPRRLPPVTAQEPAVGLPDGGALPVMPVEQALAFAEAAARNLNYLPGQVLVKFKDGVDLAGQARALSALRSRPDAGDLEWVGDVALLTDRSQPDAPALASVLARQPEVAYAEPNYLQKADFTPNDPSFSARQWNLTALNMPRVWDIAQGGSDALTVAIVDTGITTVAAQTRAVRTWNGSAIVDYALPVGPSTDLSLTRFVEPRDFIVSTVSPATTVIDTNGHGTHVGSTVGENSNNGVALAGIAFNVRLMALKACASYWDVQFSLSAAGFTGYAPLDSGGCPIAATNAAVRFAADNGAKALNYSIGGTSPSTTMRDAFVYAASKGVFCSISNGNGFESGNLTTYPASYAADIAGVMSVASVNRRNEKAYYSTTGTFTEIAAPGGDIREGNMIWQVTLLSSDSNPLSVIFPRFDRYAETGYQGTSMAAPHVAGIAALLMSRGITSNATVESLLKGTAMDLGATGRDITFGFGLVQPFVATYGSGISR
jgi:serine protease